MRHSVLDIRQLHLRFRGFNGEDHELNIVSLQSSRCALVGLVGGCG